MFCPGCGKEIKNSDSFCPYCGLRFYNRNMIPQNAGVMPNDSPSLLFAFIGFLFPLVGLILFLVYESKSPQKAKSAGKGAITNVIIKVIFIVIYLVFIAGIFGSFLAPLKEELENTISDDVYSKQMEENDEFDDVDVVFGDFIVNKNEYFDETLLEVKVKNISDSRATFFITVEAVDEDGVRIGTSTVYADKLNSGQEVYAEAFSYVEEDKLEQYKNAEFKVLEVQKYSF